MNSFALLDDEGTTDVSALAAKLPVKEVAKPAAEGAYFMQFSFGDAPRPGYRCTGQSLGREDQIEWE